MQLERSVRKLAVCFVLGLAALAAGCGAGSLSPTEQTKVDEIIKKQRGAAHKAQKDEVAKARADVQKKQSAGRKGGHRGQ